MIIFGVKKLAEELGVSRTTIYRWMDSGMPHGTKPNKQIFDLDTVKAWLLDPTNKEVITNDVTSKAN